MHGRGSSSASLLTEVRENASARIQDPKREFKSFRLALSVPLGTKRGRGRASAIDSVLSAVDTFYGEVMQSLKAWTPTPPKFREPADLPKETPSSLVSTALSSQDGAEVASEFSPSATGTSTPAEETPTETVGPLGD